MICIFKKTFNVVFISYVYLCIYSLSSSENVNLHSLIIYLSLRSLSKEYLCTFTYYFCVRYRYCSTNQNCAVCYWIIQYHSCFLSDDGICINISWLITCARCWQYYCLHCAYSYYFLVHIIAIDQYCNVCLSELIVTWYFTFKQIYNIGIFDFFFFLLKYSYLNILNASMNIVLCLFREIPGIKGFW